MLKKIIDAELANDPSLADSDVVIAIDDGDPESVSQSYVEVRDVSAGMGLTNSKYIIYPKDTLDKLKANNEKK